MEYAKYSASPTGYVQRIDASEEWEICSTGEAQAAEQALAEEKEHGRLAAQQASGVVLRSTMKASAARIAEGG